MKILSAISYYNLRRKLISLSPLFKRSHKNSMKGETASKIADLLLITAALGIVFVCPNTAKYLMKGLNRYLINKHYKQEVPLEITNANLSRALYSLKKRKLVNVAYINGEVMITLTEKGVERKLQYDLQTIQIPKPVEWDGKWRMLMFDIPEKRRADRESLRRKLKDMGFLLFQKSAWLYPYSCENEIDFLAEGLKLGEYLNLLTVKIENDEPLRARFSL